MNLLSPGLFYRRSLHREGDGGDEVLADVDRLVLLQHAVVDHERLIAVAHKIREIYPSEKALSGIVTDEVIESPRSLVIPEAANREISAQVVLKRLLEGLA